MRLLPAKIPAGLLLAALMPLSGCNLQDSGKGPIVLHLSLHDSLTRYDSVQVAIADAGRPEVDLEMVRTGHLDNPKQIASYTLTKAKDPFVVKVRGYRGNHQLALETHIYYEAGRKRVVHLGVPPQVPYNWLMGLAPSAGSLNPPFSLDQLEYTLALPPNTAVLHFVASPAYIRAVTTVAGDTMKVGQPPKVFPIVGESFVVPIVVTDIGSSRTYRVTVRPVSLKARLDSIWFSAGQLAEPFHSDSSLITLVLPESLLTVQFRFWTADDATTSLSFSGEKIFAGVARTVTLSSRPGHVQVDSVVVEKSADNRFVYTLTVRR